MRLHDEPSSESAAYPVGSRVPTAALTRALAEIEARRARQAFERAGTLTLAEALAESGVEATPEELAEEVRRVREAGAAEAARRKRHRRLRLILRAEVFSALVSGLALLSLSHAAHSPQRAAQAGQGAQVRDVLTLTQGPDSEYTIFAVPDLYYDTSSRPMYPLSILPDGCNIHSDGDLVADGPTRFQIRPAAARPGADNVWVFHDGVCYRRGWVRTSDIPSVLHGRPFHYYPEPVDDPQDRHAGLTPLTLSRRSMAETHFDVISAPATGYNTLAFTAGPPVQLDEHAWERY